MRQFHPTKQISDLFIYFFLAMIFIPRLSAQEFFIGVADIAYFPLFEFKSNRETHSKELLNAFAVSKGYNLLTCPCQ